MKLTKYIAAGTILLTMLCAAGAQEDDFGSFDDDFSSDFSDSGDDFGSFGDDDDFGSFGDFGDDSSSGLPITFSGDLSLDGRCYFAKDDSARFIKGGTDVTAVKRGDMDANHEEVRVPDFMLAAVPRAKLGLDYSASAADASLRLNICEDTIKNHPVDVIDELILRGYFFDNHLTLEGGKMKVVWGKGDKLHVIDNFNSDNYTDFIIPDYIDRRVSTPMFRAVYSFEQPSVRIEGIFTPFLPTDQSAKDGVWTPHIYAKLMQTVTQVATIKAQGLQSAMVASPSTFDTVGILSDEAQKIADDLMPNTNSIDYAQLGMHITGTTGMVDWGFSYYAGRYKQPSANAQKLIDMQDSTSELYQSLYSKYAGEAAAMVSSKAEADFKADLAKWQSDPTTYGAKLMQVVPLLNNQAQLKAYVEKNYAPKYMAEAANYVKTKMYGELDYPTLDYDRKRTFGVEAATVVGHFNVRGEFAYNLTDDIAGNDPWVHNNSIAWLAGFDIDLPINNINLNVQETGTYILNHDQIEKGKYHEYDVDYVPEDRYLNDKVVINISDSWFNDKLKPEVTFLWGIERGDWVLQPKVTYSPTPELSLSLSGMYITCRDEYSEFYEWKNNKFINIGIRYQF